MAKTEAAQVEPSKKAAAQKAANKQKQQQQNAAKRGPRPGSYHIDRRARRILRDAGAHEDDPDPSDDDLLNTRELALWLEVSTQWLEIKRCEGDGPKFIRIAPRKIMYRRGDVVAWLRERVHASTAEYTRQTNP
jgi:hypothetical protein